MTTNCKVRYTEKKRAKKYEVIQSLVRELVECLDVIMLDESCTMVEWLVAWDELSRVFPKAKEVLNDY